MIRILRIQGDSLSPEFQEGDFVILSKIPYFLAPPRPGDVVVFSHPRYGVLIKRVDASEGDLITVLGTHPHSVDSRHFGPIHRRDILGKVIGHIRGKQKAESKK